MNKFTVTRSRWERGGIYTALLNKRNGKMCCLGFAYLADGATPEQITDVCMPGSVKDDPQSRGEIRKALLGRVDEFGEGGKISSELANQAVNINDTGMGEKDREGQLIALFAEHGIEVTFED